MSHSIARILIITGIVLVVIGLVALASPKMKFLGHLPGDVRIEGKRFRFYFPIATSILLSIILTIVLNLLLRRR
jgi:hypothetical protein